MELLKLDIIAVYNASGKRTTGILKRVWNWCMHQILQSYLGMFIIGRSGATTNTSY
jgi:hypothetical protein